MAMTKLQVLSDKVRLLVPEFRSAHRPAQAKAALSPYTKNLTVWNRADTGEAYLPNPMLSGRKPAHISNPDEFIAFYEANPTPDGTRGVVFLDGSVKRVPQSDWARAKQASKLR